jgi:two-component system response regulator YesN
MPGITGIEAAQRIREKDKDCCIIFLTAFDEFSYAKKAITIRALDYLLKPYDEKELLLVLDEAMRIVDEYQTEEIRKTVTETTAGSPEGEGSGPGAAVVNGTGGDPMVETRLTDLIYQYIRDNYMFDISMQEVARTMNYSEAYFCKLFKQFFGKNFTAYLTEYRIEMAKKMLQTPTVNIKEIGKAVGYADSNYFAKVFKRVTGESPSEYRGHDRV